MDKAKKICIFGDSTAWGAWDTEKGGWVMRLWLAVGQRKAGEYISIYNCGISGGTTTDILRRFESEAKERRADALIFQTGGNDASYQGAPDNYLVPPKKFRENVAEIIKRAKRITSRIVFIRYKNCDEAKTMPVPWNDIYYTNKNIEKYNAIMKEVCEGNDVMFLDIKTLDSVDFYDGLHPNSAGHEKIFIQVKDFLLKNKWIES
ncbi:MAG: SGNH/GDSL hydrolase family protein [Patescibacteria group bacterium]